MNYEIWLGQKPNENHDQGSGYLKPSNTATWFSLPLIQTNHTNNGAKSAINKKKKKHLECAI